MSDPKEPRGAVILPFRRRSPDEPPKPPVVRDPIERRYQRAVAEATRERDALRARVGDLGDLGAAIDKLEADLSEEQRPLLASLYVFRALVRDIDEEGEGALADAARALELVPNDVDVLRRVARIRWRRGDGGAEGPIALLDRAATLAPADPATYLARAEVLAEASDCERALSNYHRVITLDPTNKAAHVGRMESLYALGRIDEALEANAAALKLDPNDADLRHVRAEYFEEKGDEEAALREQSRAVKLRPNEPYWVAERAGLRFRLGQWSEALADYSRAMQLEPDEGHFPASRAVVHWKLGDIDKALADIALAMRVDPEAGKYHWQRGNIHVSRADFEAAIADITIAVEREPDDLGFRADLARSYLLAQRWDEGLAVARECLSRAPGDPDMHILYAEILKRKGDRAASLEALANGTKAAPGSAAMHLAYGRRLFEMGNHPGAAEAANAALELSPDDADALLIRGASRCYLTADLAPEEDMGGFADFDRAAVLAPNNPMVWLHRGGVLFRRGKLNEALPELDKAVALGPHIDETFFARGRVLVDLAEFEMEPAYAERAIPDLLESLRRKPNVAITHHLLGVAHGISERWAEAVVELDRAIELAPMDAEAWYQRAKAHHEVGDVARSEADLEQAVSLGHEVAEEELGLSPEERFP